MTDAYPPVGFHFNVRFLKGVVGEEASFQEAGGIGPEMGAEEYREGGENRFTHSLPTGVKHPKLRLKRGLAHRSSGLVLWAISVLEGGLAWPIRLEDVQLRLLNAFGNPLRIWTFHDAYPTHWTVDPFQADRASVAIETFELAYSRAERASFERQK